MLYFEDFMEDIEDLPNEFTENLTAIRQLDLQAQNIIEPLDNKVNGFFQKCHEMSISETQQNDEYDSLIKDYEKVEEISQDKIKITDQTLETFNKMIKKMDAELLKFRLELEADNPGNPAAIERLVDDRLENGVTETNQRIERKRTKKRGETVGNRSRSSNQFYNSSAAQSTIRKAMKANQSDNINRNNEDRIGSISNNADALMTAVNNGSISPASSFMSSAAPARHDRKFDWKQQYSVNDSYHSQLSTGSRTKKSERRRYKVLSSIGGVSEDSTGTNEEFDDGRRSLDGSSLNRTSAGSNFDGFSYTGNTGESTSSAAFLQHQQQHSRFQSHYHYDDHAGMPGSSADHQSTVDDDGDEDASEDDDALTTPVEPPPGFSQDSLPPSDEPRYCFCNEVSYGEMIACDEPGCPREWFHYGCVNLTVAPKGHWFCRECKQQRQRASQHSHSGAGSSSGSFSNHGGSQYSRR